MKLSLAPPALPGEISLSAAAERLGLTVQSLGQWCSRPGAPCRKAGRRVWCLWPDFARWREQQLIAQAMPASLDEVRTRKLNAEAQLAELDLAQRRGELAEVAEMDQAVEALALAVRSEISGLRSRFASRIVGLTTPLEAATELDAMSAQILEALRGHAASLTDDEPDTPTGPTP